MFRQFKELIRKEVLILLRDRQTVMLLFLMPVALIFFLSLALKGVYVDKVAGHKVRLIIENASQSSKSLKLEQRIASSPIVERMTKPGKLDEDRIFETSDVQAAVFIPRGFEDGEHPVQVRFDPVLDAGYRIAIHSLISGHVMEVVMDAENLEQVVSQTLLLKR